MTTGTVAPHRSRLAPERESLWRLVHRPRILAKTRWRTTVTSATFPEAGQGNEEVAPVNVSIWVLPSGVTVGR
jgi:hypothetical protein